jgi:predicted  nucleic acid-binding Zn-ribbon protein
LLAAGGGLVAVVSGIKYTLEALHPLHLKWALVEDTNKKMSKVEIEVQEISKTVSRMDSRLGSIEASLATITKQSGA